MLHFRFPTSNGSARVECENQCDVMFQVRYIEWFYTDSIARVECENLYMVPLSRAVYEAVVDQVLKRVQCEDRNVHDMVQAEKEEEWLSLQTWRTPVYVAVPVIGESGSLRPS